MVKRVYFRNFQKQGASIVCQVMSDRPGCRNANLWKNNWMVGVKDEEVRFFIVSVCHYGGFS